MALNDLSLRAYINVAIMEYSQVNIFWPMVYFDNKHGEYFLKSTSEKTTHWEVYKKYCKSKKTITQAFDNFTETSIIDHVGLRHNEHGPAIIYNNQDCEYWVYGLRHCIDGPAIDYPAYNYEEWWLYGVPFNTEQVLNSAEFTEGAKKKLLFNLDRSRLLGEGLI